MSLLFKSTLPSPGLGARTVTGILGGTAANPTYPLTPTLLTALFPSKFVPDRQAKVFYGSDAVSGGSLKKFDSTNPGAGVVTLIANGALGYQIRYMDISLDNTTLYATTTSDQVIKIVISTLAVTVLAGSGTSGNANGTGTAAQFNGCQGIAVEPNAGLTLIVYDQNTANIRNIVISPGVVTTPGVMATNQVAQITMDKQGFLYREANVGMTKCSQTTGSSVNIGSYPSTALGWGTVDNATPSPSQAYIIPQNGGLHRVDIASGTDTLIAPVANTNLGNGGCMYFRPPGVIVLVDASNNLMRISG